ncbi:MAG: C39 family peptidase [Polyangiaceae bacterium]
MAATDQEILSQSNPKNSDGNFWCGRTSASIVFNYYARLGKVRGGPIKNQSDKEPYQLLYTDGARAAYTADGQCAPMETFDRLTSQNVGKWEEVALWPKDKRSGGEPATEATFGKLLDHLDRNNPAFFSSGFSENEKYASHFVTITGYRFKNGSLWLQITDPATSYDHVRKLLKAGGASETVANSLVEVEQNGAWAVKDSTVKPFASRYWVHSSVFWYPNTKLKNHPAMVEKGYPDPLLCDNSFRPGFAVIIDTSGLQTSDAYAETELAAGWPIMPTSHVVPSSPPALQHSIEELGLWNGVIDASSSYPLGSALTWHGGVHVSAGSAQGRLVYAMGPGEVVLARFPDEDPKARKPSNGFVLIKHRIDRVRRALIEPTVEKPDDPLDVYSLYMHLGPLREFLERDEEQGIDVLKSDAARWLRAICPERLPRKRRFVSACALRHLVFHADADAANRGTWTSMIPSKSEAGQVGADLELVESGGKVTLADQPTEEVTIGGAKHFVLPCGGVSTKALGAKQLAIFQPTTVAADKLHYFNPLTQEVIKVASVAVDKGAPVLVEEADPPRVASIAIGDKTYVRLVYEAPGVFDHQAGMIEGESLRVFTSKVTLTVRSGDAAQTIELDPSSHRLFFEFAGDKPLLTPVVTATKQELASWQAAARSKSKSPTPLTVPRERVTHLFNTVTEELVPVSLPVGGYVPLAVTPGPAKPTIRSAELAKGVYAEVLGVDVELAHEPGDGAAGDKVVFFEHGTSAIALYRKTAGADTKRYFVKESVVSIKNADALLAFRCTARDSTGGDPKQARAWLDLRACVPVSPDQLAAWNAELDSAARTRLGALRRRLQAGTTRLMGVKLAPVSPKSGWALEKKGAELVIQPAPFPEGVEGPRMLCEVDFKDGALALQEIKLPTSASPWAVAVPDGSTIHPVCVLEGKDKKPWGAVFEVMATTPAVVLDNDTDRDGIRSERNLVRDANRERSPRVAGYRKGEILEPPRGPLAQVSRAPIGCFDGEWIHVEVFAAENPIDKKAKGTNEKVERIPNTAFHVLRDDDSKDDYTSRFVQTIVTELVGGLGHLGTGALTKALAEKSVVVRPDEWSAFCSENAGALSRVVTAHASEWHPSQVEVLDASADARGLHRDEPTVKADKDEIKRFAFLDKLKDAPPSTALYHVHPFRFLEWILTGADVTVKGAPSAKLKLELGKDVRLDVTKDETGEGKSAAKDAASRPATYRVRTMLGDGLPSDWGTLVLESGFKTTQPRLPVLIKRSNTSALTVVNPVARAHFESDSRVGLDTIVGVSIRDSVKDGALLPDGGKLPFHQLSCARAVVEVEYNYHPPTKISVKLDGPGFRLQPVTEKLALASDAQSASFAPPARSDSLFNGAQSVAVVVDVLAQSEAGKTSKIRFEVEGGDFPSTATSELEVRTTSRMELGDGPGEDIAKLQLYLSQIEDQTGRPCYRYAGVDKAKEVEYQHGGKQKVLVDGHYKSQLARALWRFFYTYAATLKTEKIELPPPKSKSKAKAQAQAQPAAPTSVAVADLRTGANGAAEARATREGPDNTQYPAVTPAVIADVIRHLAPPHVIPKVSMTVKSGTGVARADMLKSVALGDGWKTSDESRSALLPIEGDSITLVVAAPSMAYLGGSITVELDLNGAGAYKLTSSAAGKLELTQHKHEFQVTLEYARTSIVPANNIVTAKATVDGNLYTLGSIQLYGCRDLTGAPKDGVSRRDSALVQAALAAHGYYVPPNKVIDGKWMDAVRNALKAFIEKDAKASGPAAIKALIEMPMAASTP